MTSHRLILLCLLPLGAAIAPAAENPLQGKPIGELRKVLADGATERERLNAAQAIAATIPAKPLRDPRTQRQSPAANPVAADVVAALLPGLDDPAGSVRYVCRQALGRSGVTALPGLLAALKSGNPDARSYAADALADMAQYADAPTVPLEQAVPGLSQALKDGHYAVRVSACLALKQLGPRAAAALPGLVAALDDREWAVAEAAVQGVAAVDPAGTTAVPALVKVLERSPHELREIVCQELGTLGPNAKAAVPALIKLLDADKSDWFAGKAAATTLMKIAAYDARTTPEDPAADVRPQIIAAIAKSAASQQTPFVKAERLTALFVAWKYLTMDELQLPGGWNTAGFNDSAWQESAAPVCSPTPQRKGPENLWDKPFILLRRTFDVADPAYDALRIKALVHDEADIYLNGVHVARMLTQRRKGNAFIDFDVTSAGLPALKQGTNVLAVKAVRDGGHIDVGIMGVKRP